MNNYQTFGYGQMAQPTTYALPRIHGRPVSSVGEIGIGDVPTDGSTGLFPAHDGSCVWAKRWNANGSVTTLRYVPEPMEVPNLADDGMAALEARIEALEAAVAKKKRKEAADASD